MCAVDDEAYIACAGRNGRQNSTWRRSTHTNHQLLHSEAAQRLPGAGKWRRAVPVPNPLLVFVPSAFALVAFLVSAIILWKVYKHGGADDVAKVARALAELRPHNVVARAIEACKIAPKLSEP